MLLTLTTTHRPATDLGYLLSKHPARVQEFSLAFGRAHVFYPEASEERCTAALLLDIDPVGLVRGKPGSHQDGPLDQYVNDRPYAASSLLGTAIARVFRSAMAGDSKARPDLAATPIPLVAHLPAIACRGGEPLVRRLFEPLGYTVECTQHPLDPARPDWGGSRVHSLTLTAEVRLADLLSHLYVLIPVLDGNKHYWIGKDEVDKLLRIAADWLPSHPEQEIVTRRFLGNRRHLARRALDQLMDGDTAEQDRAADAGEATVEKPIKLDQQRRIDVAAALEARGVTTVADLGCGEAKLVRHLASDRRYTRLVGLDVSLRSLEVAERRLKLGRTSKHSHERIQLLHGSLLYKDRRLEGFDAITLIEVIEHMELDRLDAMEAVVFGEAAPRVVVVTTPNVEYNRLFPTLPAGKFRHGDHRFEWTRAEFVAWAEPVAERHGYAVSFAGIGPEDPECGSPTQMAVFERGEET
mgnify:CR=1 FL=1